MQILLATGNIGKQREFARLLAPLSTVTPAALGLHLEVEESGATFAQNSMLKARAFAQAAGLIALADDSGLEVSALGGAPGVLSARFGGPGLSDAQRWAFLLAELARLPEETSRAARFRCCVVAAAADGRSCTAEGSCEGEIARQPSGADGFGYDPVFLLPEIGRTMAQISADHKNRISHRALAMGALRPKLISTFPELSSDG
jgi:XTP/dITP diphosphohydrolase